MNIVLLMIKNCSKTYGAYHVRTFTQPTMTGKTPARKNWCSLPLFIMAQCMWRLNYC